MAGKRRTSVKNKKTRAARHHATPAQAAQEYERLVEQFPEDREELLREAADAWRSAGEYDRALVLYGRLLDPAAGGCQEPDVVDAWRIDTLREAGYEKEARTAAASFRARHPKDTTAWSIVAGTLEYADGDGDSRRVVHDGRHARPRRRRRGDGGRGRRLSGHLRPRLLGDAHGDWDAVADELHERRAAPVVGRVRPVDELHDPLRLKRLAEGGPDTLEAEFKELAREPDEETWAPTGPLRTCVLFWPPEEFAQLLEPYPTVADAYGDDHTGHLRQVERTLRELSDQGALHLAVGRATVTGLEAHVDENGGSPTCRPPGPGMRPNWLAGDWRPTGPGPQRGMLVRFGAQVQDVLLESRVRVNA